MKKVVKFGGSSLASAEQFTKVKDIICSDIDRVMWFHLHRESVFLVTLK